MSEKQMRIIEQLAEIIMDQVEFKDKRELHKFTNDLKNELISLYDPEFIYSESESESSDETDDDGEAEIIITTQDNDGFMKLK
jgi:hypothetical protein